MTLTIAGQPLDEADLPDLLEQAPADPPVAGGGARSTRDRCSIWAASRSRATCRPAARDQLGLAPGAPAVAADVLAAQQRLLTAIREAGHPLAKVDCRR